MYTRYLDGGWRLRIGPLCIDKLVFGWLRRPHGPQYVVRLFGRFLSSSMPVAH